MGEKGKKVIISSNHWLGGIVGPITLLVGLVWSLLVSWLVDGSLTELLLALAILIVGAVIMIRGWKEIFVDLEQKVLIVREAAPTFTSQQEQVIKLDELHVEKTSGKDAEGNDYWNLELIHTSGKTKAEVWSISDNDGKNVNRLVDILHACGVMIMQEEEEEDGD